MKKLATIFGVLALALMFTASPVMAAEVDVEATNDTTGAESTNVNEVDVENEGEVDVENDADVTNSASASVNTGGNEQEENTEAGELETGDVDASTDWDTVVNEGFDLCSCLVGGNGLDVDVDFTNDTTGFNSDNTNELDVENDGEVDIDNMADVLNSLFLAANTGDNEQNRNTTAGDLETGDVEGIFNIATWANVSDGEGNGGSDSSIDVTATNDTTGADSDNTNEVDVELGGDVEIDNDADVTTSVAVSANTGGNTQNRNTTVEDLETGDVTVETNVETVANSGNCCVKGGSHSVDADLTNDTTGADSDNTNEVDVELGGDVEIDNDADVTNTLNVEANTGDNEQNENTSGGDVETGSVTIDFTSSTTVNSSN